jgi:hypothetical protein
MKTVYKLYVKESPLGLKYLGVTKNDPIEYLGSGLLWQRHLKKHKLKSKNIKTKVLLETENKNELIKKGIYFSNLFNVVESDEWANLKVESGEGGSLPWSEEKKRQFGEKRKGKKNPFYRGKLSEEHMAVIKDRCGKKNPVARSVEQIDINSGKVIKIFETIREASKSIKVLHCRVWAVCNGNLSREDNYLTSGGYVWRYTK